MNKEFVQPDPYTCVPTAFAYLLYKEYGLNFQEILNTLVAESYKRYSDIKENGMEFDQIQEVANALGYKTQLTTTKPTASAYLAGVTQLPKQAFEYNDFIREAVKEDSLRIEGEFFVYPFGHAVAVFEKENNVVIIFDSLFGTETQISLDELEKYLEQPTTYLSI